MKNNLLFILLFITSLPLFSQELAGGFVFEDTNRNGRKDRRETGIADVAVSNGTDVVLTRSDGSYRIPVKSGNTLFVIKPARSWRMWRRATTPSSVSAWVISWVTTLTYSLFTKSVCDICSSPGTT